MKSKKGLSRKITRRKMKKLRRFRPRSESQTKARNVPVRDHIVTEDPLRKDIAILIDIIAKREAKSLARKKRKAEETIDLGL